MGLSIVEGMAIYQNMRIYVNISHKMGHEFHVCKAINVCVEKCYRWLEMWS